MGIIVNGFLIGSKKSAGGINFYKRMGKTCFRNKPTLSKDYVPSSAQTLQRNVMKFCGNLAKATENNLILMKGGWGGNKKSTGETNYNNIVRALVYGITRNWGNRDVRRRGSESRKRKDHGREVFRDRNAAHTFSIQRISAFRNHNGDGNGRSYAGRGYGRRVQKLSRR